MLHLRSGNIDRAIVHFRESLKLNQSSAPTHYNLGIALSLQRQLDAALAEFREAIGLDPQYAEAYNNAGAMLHLGGKLEEASAHYRRALELRPDNVDARSNLGRILTTTGQDAAAVEQFRQVLATRADHASALTGLGWVLATSSNPGLRDAKEAVLAAQRASALTGDADPTALDALAAAYASAGDFARAVSTAEKAVEASRSRGAAGLTDQIRARLVLYQKGQPFRR